MIFPPDPEKRMIMSSFVWTKHRNVTDGRTDGQTDKRTEFLWLLQRFALRTMRTRCKDYWSDFHESFTKDVSLDTEDTVKFGKSSTLGFQSQNLKKDSLTLQDRLRHFYTIRLVSLEKPTGSLWKLYQRCIFRPGRSALNIGSLTGSTWRMCDLVSGMLQSPVL